MKKKNITNMVTNKTKIKTYSKGRSISKFLIKEYQLETTVELLTNILLKRGYINIWDINKLTTVSNQWVEENYESFKKDFAKEASHKFYSNDLIDNIIAHVATYKTEFGSAEEAFKWWIWEEPFIKEDLICLE